MLLLIDNYDSFTHNVAHYFRELGQVVQVVQNDAISLAEIDALRPSHLVISPGPCTPSESGISLDVIDAFKGRIPLLGICLGHQCIAQSLGADIVRAAEVVHGKTSMIHHQAEGLFDNLPNPFEATRYHSLVVDEGTLPNEVEVSAWTPMEVDPGRQSVARIVMGISVPKALLEGVQFHPEAILTQHGHRLFDNFLRLQPQVKEIA